MPTAAVFVKSVPVGGRFLRLHDGALTRDEVPHGIDPINEVALEWALQAREAGGVDRVVALCMGPETADDALRRAVAMGCEETIRLTAPGLSGADVRTTARVLATAARDLDAGLALFGNESLDGSSGVVPAAVATLLSWPLLSLARTAVLDDAVVRCERDLGTGPQTAEAPLPAVVSFVAGGVSPRYPKLREVLASRSAPLGRSDVDAPVASGGERVLGVHTHPQPERTASFVSAAEGVDAILEAVKAAR